MRSGADLSTVKYRRFLLVNARTFELVHVKPDHFVDDDSLNKLTEGAVVEYVRFRPAHIASPLPMAALLPGNPCPILRSGHHFARDLSDILPSCAGSDRLPAS
jgi:hypothetical protein